MGKEHFPGSEAGKGRLSLLPAGGGQVTGPESLRAGHGSLMLRTSVTPGRLSLESPRPSGIRSLQTLPLTRLPTIAPSSASLTHLPRQPASPPPSKPLGFPPSWACWCQPLPRGHFPTLPALKGPSLKSALLHPECHLIHKTFSRPHCSVHLVKGNFPLFSTGRASSLCFLLFPPLHFVRPVLLRALCWAVPSGWLLVADTQGVTCKYWRLM